jgi:hypothetical protein
MLGFLFHYWKFGVYFSAGQAWHPLTHVRFFLPSWVCALKEVLSFMFLMQLGW